jgi:glycosyltransferase involved in cell wall biosynthesis
MRLLVVTHEYPPLPGGAGVGVRHLAERLAARGHPVTVLTAGPRGAPEREGGVAVVRVGCGARPGRPAGPRVWLGFLARAPGRIREMAERFAPDGIASFFPVAAGLAVARAGCAAPHVTSFVGADIHDPTRRWVAADTNPVIRGLTARALRHAAAVTAGSSDMVRRIEATFPGCRVRRLPLGVPPLRAPGATRADLDLPDDAFVIVTVCRLVRRKRLDLLIAAVARLDPTARLVVVGDGPAAPALRAQAARLGIAARVRFAGHVDEARKAAYLASADVFCLPSAHEAFGLAIVEALGLGTPVVTTNRGGQPDIVRDGIEGLLVDPGDVEALRARLARLRHEPATRARMRAAASERARAFTPDATADGFLDLFRSLGVRSSNAAP